MIAFVMYEDRSDLVADEHAALVVGQDVRALPWESTRTELRASWYSLRFSRSGRSDATAIIIPKMVEIHGQQGEGHEDGREPALLERAGAWREWFRRFAMRRAGRVMLRSGRDAHTARRPRRDGPRRGVATGDGSASANGSPTLARWHPPREPARIRRPPSRCCAQRRRSVSTAGAEAWRAARGRREREGRPAAGQARPRPDRDRTSTSATRWCCRSCASSRTSARGVLIVGDYTARVGDPSGRTATRPVRGAPRSTPTPDLPASRRSRSSSTIPTCSRSASTPSGWT